MQILISKLYVVEFVFYYGFGKKKHIIFIIVTQIKLILCTEKKKMFIIQI